MKNLRDKVIRRIHQLLLLTQTTQRITHIPQPIRFYTLMISGKDSRISIGKRTCWSDKRNGSNPYRDYCRFVTRFTRQIRERKAFNHTTFLASSIENPWHVNNRQNGIKSIYSHAHVHGLVMTTEPSEAESLQIALERDFDKVFGYQPSYCSVRPLVFRPHSANVPVIISNDKLSNSIAKNTIAKFVKYIFTDYHIQTKDCSFSIFRKLPYCLRHDITLAQANSTKGLRVQRYVSNRHLDSLSRRLKQLMAKKLASDAKAISSNRNTVRSIWTLFLSCLWRWIRLTMPNHNRYAYQMNLLTLLKYRREIDYQGRLIRYRHIMKSVNNRANGFISSTDFRAEVLEHRIDRRIESDKSLIIQMLLIGHDWIPPPFYY